MSDDFLKKISNKESTDKNNPFNQIFQKKRDTVRKENPVIEKKEAGLDGIENLGKTGTPAAEVDFETDVPADKIPSKKIADENILETQNENIDKSTSSIPTKNLENSDIFKDNTDDAEGKLIINTSSSYNNLDFGSENSNQNPFTQDIINKVSQMLKENKWKDAVKLIEGTKNE